jgi:hypothetical protein
MNYAKMPVLGKRSSLKKYSIFLLSGKTSEMFNYGMHCIAASQ